MDKVIEQTQVFRVWGFPTTMTVYNPPYTNAQATGAGTWIGIIDTGIDYKHLDFKPLAGGNRVKFIWDQLTSLGNPPPEFTYGRHWTTNEIENETVTTIDADGRGTLLAGIMAASGRATAGTWSAYRYVGMAPEANLVVVKCSVFGIYSGMSTQPWSNQLGIEGKVADAVNYCFYRANGAPCVVLIPMGHFRGAHDGQYSFDQTISGISTSGPGKIIVSCAGNDRRARISGQNIDHPFHAAMNLTAIGNQASVTFLIPDYIGSSSNSEVVEFEAWHDLTASFSVRLSSPNGISTGWVTPGSAVNLQDTADGSIQLQNALTTTTTPIGKRIYWRLYEITEGVNPRNGTWKLEAERLSGTTTGILDCWFTGQHLSNTFNPVTFTGGTSYAKMVCSPGTGDGVISAGYYISKISWLTPNGTTGLWPGGASFVTHTLGYSTSPGPRRDGQYRPDLMAPGQGVVASRSADQTAQPDYYVEDGVHRIWRGSEAAAAVVAGGIALYLENNPQASVEEVRAWVRGNARSDSYTGVTPNGDWGYGKLTVYPSILPPLAMAHTLVSATQQNFRFTALGGVTFDTATINETNVIALHVSTPVDTAITNITSTSFVVQTQETGPPGEMAITCSNIKDPDGRVFGQDTVRYDIGSGTTVIGWV